MSVTAQGCTKVAGEVMGEVDRTISTIARADCEVMRAVHGGSFCQDPDLNQVQAPVYCYRRLGGIDCYDRQIPGDRPILRQDQAHQVKTSDLTTY
jgi:hypothetical protein